MVSKITKILILIQLVLLLSVICSDKSKQQKSKAKVLKFNKPVLDQNHYANKEFSKFPNGRDKYEKIEEDEIFLEDVKLSPTAQDKVDSQYNKQLIKLNRNALFYSNPADKSYRGIKGSIQLSEILSLEDQPETGNCCKSMSEINKAKITVMTVEYDVKCFTINAKHDKWKLCFLTLEKAQFWRKNLVMRIIIMAMEKQGIFNVNFVSEVGATRKKSTFSWTDQDSWGLKCKTGQAQSPIQIQTATSQTLTDMRLKFDLNKHVFNNDGDDIKEKHKFEHAHATFDGQQVNIKGNFGSIMHEVKEKYRAYYIDKIQFKFQSEHTIDNVPYDCEILIHAETESKQRSITSVLLRADTEGGADEVKFLDDIDSELWTLKKDSPVKLEKQPDLKDLFKSVVQNNFALSYFWYMGSLSEPTCDEGINRFVIDIPVKVPKAQIDVIKRHAYDSAKEIKGNFRIPIPYDNSRQIFHHQEVLCDKKKIIDDVEIDTDIVSPTKTDDKVDPQGPEKCDDSEKKILEAKSEIVSYTYTDKDIQTGQIKDGVLIENIEADQLPQNIQSALVKQASLQAQNKCNKAKYKRKETALETRRKEYEHKYSKKTKKSKISKSSQESEDQNDEQSNESAEQSAISKSTTQND